MRGNQFCPFETRLTREGEARGLWERNWPTTWFQHSWWSRLGTKLTNSTLLGRSLTSNPAPFPADFWTDVLLGQHNVYRECVEHYGFLISSCRPRMSRRKREVEPGGLHYVRRNFLCGRESTTSLEVTRDDAVWASSDAGLHLHGTAKEQFGVRVEHQPAHPAILAARSLTKPP